MAFLIYVNHPIHIKIFQPIGDMPVIFMKDGRSFFAVIGMIGFEKCVDFITVHRLTRYVLTKTVFKLEKIFKILHLLNLNCKHSNGKKIMNLINLVPFKNLDMDFKNRVVIRISCAWRCQNIVTDCRKRFGVLK